mmetsp:Transcript_21017/g.35657  ORF Transcript_21017/g.35657 Transcript_21017/m.35657 type:complete len:216 (+) Transcript_21017:306-953(+)
MGHTGPVGSTISNQFPTQNINLILKHLHLILTNRHKHRLQILRIKNFQILHHLFFQHIIQIHSSQIPPLLPLGILQCGLFVPIRIGQLFQFLINGRHPTGNQRDQFLQGATVGILGIIPCKLLYVSGGRDTPHSQLGGLFSGKFHGRLFDFSDNAFDDGVGFSKVVGEVHEGVEGADHEGGDFEFEHFAVGGGGAGGGILEFAEGVFGGRAGVGD